MTSFFSVRQTLRRCGVGLGAVFALFLAGVASPVFAADVTAPVVGVVTPVMATAGQPITLSASYTDETGVTFCQLYQPVNQTILGVISVNALTSGTASLLWSFSSVGNYSVQWQCRDAAGNWGNGPQTTVTVYASAVTDTTPPTVSAVSPLTGVANMSVTLSASYSDAVGVTQCSFYQNSDTLLGSVSVNAQTSGVVSLAHTYASAGSYPVYANCRDAAGNMQNGALSTIVISSTGADTTPPSVTWTAVPTSATVGSTVTYGISYTENVNISSCQLMDGGQQFGTFSISGVPTSGTGVLAVNYTQYQVGTRSITARCQDQSGNWGSTSASNVVVSGTSQYNGDQTAPTVSAVSPGSGVTTGVTTNFSATFSDGVGVTYCQLVEGSTVLGTTTISPSSSNGTANIAVTLYSSRTYALQMQCRDAAGNMGYGMTTSEYVSVSSGNSSAPVVGQVYLSTDSPMSGNSTWYYVSASGNLSISQCRLLIDGVDLAAMTQQSVGSFAFQYAFPVSYQDIVHTASARCTDSSGNNGYSVSTKSFHVLPNTSGNGVDTSVPVVGAVSPTTVTPNQSTTFYATYNDARGVVQCKMLRDGSVSWIGSSFASQTSGSVQLTDSLSQGTHTLQFGCVDSSGNWGYGPATTVYAGTSYGNGQSLTVGMVDQSSVPSGVFSVVSASVTDNVSSVSRCSLYINGNSQGNMSLMGNVASQSYYFSNPGNYSVYVTCWDAAGNTSSSSVRTVYASSYGSGQSGLPGPGSLIKMTCPSYVAPGHPCTAVYYYGTDGKRHAFPNAGVYRTWFPDFSGVLEVSDIFLANIPLGKNVQYRPGVRMVKFTTDPKVYAVSRRGILRWVTSESIASTIYGPYWNQMIDDLPDTLYTSYTFGADIGSATSFVPSNEMSNTTSIDANY